jgi:hypothetical protein
MLAVLFTVNLSLDTLYDSLLLLKVQVKLFGSGNESTGHNTLRLEPIFAPTEDLFSNAHLGASEIMNRGKVEYENSLETHT